ncbi:MAG TPA: exosortase system-associated protein, TIGR04073 family [Verrucomicrobiae bacterium]|nr:exosortase system-associated protein, TIGR04073 family [Verrucomicrobiae bacterium]
MKKVIPFLALAALLAAFTSGCTGPEQKFSRGVDNVYDVVRLGEMQRSIEQNVVLDSDNGYVFGTYHGFHRSLERAGLGVYEIITAPFPPYHPILTKHFSPNPVYPDSYQPKRYSDSIFDTDSAVGFSGGDIAPFIPGSRFNVFDN